MLDNDGRIIVEDAIGWSDDLQIFVLQDDLVVVLFGTQVETRVGQIGILPEQIKIKIWDAM